MDKREMTQMEKIAHVKKVDLTNKTYDILSELISHQITMSDAIDQIYNYYNNNLINKIMRKYFKELEFEYDMKTYYCDGYADIWHENVFGTQYDGECEVLIETGITHIEIEKIDVVIDGVASDVTNDLEVIEVAKEVVTDKIETL